MNRRINYGYRIFILISISINILFISIKYVIPQGYAFDPVPFKEIPFAGINSTTGSFKLEADLSLDFGGPTSIIQNNNTTPITDLKLDKDDEKLALAFDCETNNKMCDLNSYPERVEIYLVDNTIRDNQIAENSVPMLKLGSKSCDGQTLERCGTLDSYEFFIPSNILIQKYKMVILAYFDEAEWYFINPIEINE